MTSNPIKIALLGSTGSIGRSTLEVVAASHGDDSGRGPLGPSKNATSARSGQSGATEVHCGLRSAKPPPSKIGRNCRQEVKLLVGPEAVAEVVVDPEIDIVVSAIVGSAGLRGTWAALEAGKTVALANKESLVVGGPLVTKLAKEKNARLLPVDSEHSAVFQALQAGRREEVKRVILTASGGPFRNHTPEQLAQVTIEEALAHPTWAMGPKITIDSATLMNKALEIIEARWLFDLTADQISVMIHPQSIVHSMVEYKDGSVIAQLSVPDMKLPIQYALTWPHRCEGVAAKLDWSQGDDSHVRAARFRALRRVETRLGSRPGGRHGGGGAQRGQRGRRGRLPRRPFEVRPNRSHLRKHFASSSLRSPSQPRSSDSLRPLGPPGGFSLSDLISILTVCWYIVEILLGVGFVIFVHELGHFAVAKLCGVKCEKFYLGFDIGGWKFCKFRWGETEYGIGILPLGGYVKMLGQEDNPAKLKEEIERAKLQQAERPAPDQPTADGQQPTTDVDLAQAEKALYDPRSYLAKSVPKRMAIISAGVIMNVIFAFLMAAVAYAIGVEQLVCVVGKVFPGEAAWRADLRPGDRILEIDGKKIGRFDDIHKSIPFSDITQGVTMLIERPGEKKPLKFVVHPDRIKLAPSIGVIQRG